MPRVPRRTQQEIAPGRIPATGAGANVSIATFGGGAAPARQTDIVRETLGLAFKVSETVRKKREEAAAQAKTEMDKMLVLDADLKTAQDQNDLDLEMRDMKGRDSVNAMDFITNEWEKRIEVTRKELFNEDQREAFEIAQQQRFLSLKKATGVHINTQLNQYSRNVWESSIKAIQEQTAINYTDIEFVSEQFARIEPLVSDRAEREGLGKEWRDRTIFAARSKTHAGIVERMLFDDEVELADAYQKQFIKEILNDDLDIINKSKSESESLRKARKVEADREWSKGILFGPLDNIDIRRRVETDPDYTPKRAKSDLTTVAQRWNDPRRQAVDKADAENKLIELWLDAGGEIDPLTGRLTETITTKKQEKLLALREFALRNKGLLTQARVKSIMNATEIPDDSATSTKYRMMRRSQQDMLQFSPSPAVNQVLVNVAAKIIQPNATIAQAQEELEKASDTLNTDKALLPVGTVLNQGDIITYRGVERTVPRTMTIMSYRNGVPQLKQGQHKVVE